jgi:hypothetical protein
MTLRDNIKKEILELKNQKPLPPFENSVANRLRLVIQNEPRIKFLKRLLRRKCNDTKLLYLYMQGDLT